LKIVFIITGLSTGGAEMMLLKVLERLDTRFSPYVISLTSLSEIGPRIQALNVPVEALGMKPGRVPNPIAFARLVGRLKALKPEVVHTWMYHADLLGGLAARLAGVRAVGWAIHYSNLSRRDNKYSTLAVMKICSLLSDWLPDQILSCSEAARLTHVAYGYPAKKMVVVPNGFDTTLFQPDTAVRIRIREELGISVETPLVGLIGRFDLQKNHFGFIKAATYLHCRLSNVHFLLAGKGVDKENDRLVCAIEQAGLTGSMHLLGLRSDVQSLMAALDVYASSSSYGEAFPIVVGEAMACGVPCVVTDVGDSAYIVGDTGRVVLPGDMTGLAVALEALLTLPHVERIALGERARGRVTEHFEIGAVVKRYEAFYEELAAKGRSEKKQ
jgi:glycosyltransferase involved in cell wall biosynthesis